MNSFSIPRIKSVIRQINFQQAKKILVQILAMDNALAIRKYLNEALSFNLTTLLPIAG